MNPSRVSCNGTKSTQVMYFVPSEVLRSWGIVRAVAVSRSEWRTTLTQGKFMYEVCVCVPVLITTADFTGDLGFNTSVKINLQDLTDIFEEELQSNEHTDVYHYAVASYLNEMQHVKSYFDQVKTERDKLKSDLNEANTRATILAQEVDDHHAKLEQSSQNKIMILDKKYQDHVKSLQLELEREREQVVCHESVLKQQLSGEIELMKKDDAKIKDELGYMKKENGRLEQELADLIEKYDEASRLNSLHQKELDSLAELRQKNNLMIVSFHSNDKDIPPSPRSLSNTTHCMYATFLFLSELAMVDLESGHNYLEDQQYQSLLDELENGREETQELNDRNDELSMEVESLRRKLASNERPSKRHKKNGSWLDDYTKLSPSSSLKRRESGSSTEDGLCNSDEEPVLGKIRKRVSLSPINQERMSIEVETLEEHHKEEIENLTGEYDRAILDLQDSYDVQLIKLKSQLHQKCSSNSFNEDGGDSVAEVKRLSSELQNFNKKLEKQKNLNDEAKKQYEEICIKLNKELEYQKKLLADVERNHLTDKNELITRLEREHEERVEQAQNEWYQRLEELRQESGDELESGPQRECQDKRMVEKVTGSELIEQLEEQKLAMKRKYKNLKSQLSVTTEELEMALAREAQAEKLHSQLENRCLEVEERLVKMASGLDTSSETSTEFVSNLSNDDQMKNKPTEVIVMEIAQLKRRNALLVTRCGALERSLHAAKAREYFGSEFYSADANAESKTDEGLQAA
ncbi:Ninein [Nymphon striatum]|nr:Ninein [Nymphon striatum]